MQTEKQIKIGEQTFEVSYPLVGQKLTIENVKLMLTDNNYGDLARSGHNTAVEFLDLVDAVSYFAVLIPELKSSLKVEDFLKMDPKTAKMYVKAYKKQFDPWMAAIDKEINKDDEAEQSEAEIAV